MITSARRVASALLALLAALVVPDRGVPRLVGAGRFRLAMALVVGAALLAAAATGSRLDVGPEVRAENAGRKPSTQTPAKAGAGSPDLSEVKTDRQIDDEIEKRTAVRQVKLGLGAGLGTPVKLLALGFFLYVLGSYVGGAPTLQRSLAAAAVGALPWAVHDVIAAVITWRQAAITPADLDGLVASRIAVALDHPFLARLLARADLFALWSVVLWGFGLAAAAGLGRVRAFVTVGVGFTLYVLLTTAGA